MHEVELSPFFLSKYEMTQAQWERIGARNPSIHTPFQVPYGVASLLHPVEWVSWFDRMEMMGRLGLCLPSEAQWEYAARAGLDTPWWSGSERDSLRGKVNIQDLSANDNLLTQYALDWEDLDDGWVTTAPASSFPPNDFGLHEVAGNVWEWCLDAYDDGFYGRSPVKDPVLSPDAGGGVLRGGAYNSNAADTRSSRRIFQLSDGTADLVGLRPARGVTP